MRDAFEAAKGQLDFVSVTPHAMWPDISKLKDDPRLAWVVGYHTDAFVRLKKGNYRKYVEMTNEYNKEGEFLTFIGYEAHSLAHGDHVALHYDLDAPLVYCTSIEDWKQKMSGRKVFITPHHMGYQKGYRGYDWDFFTEGDQTPFVEMYSRHGLAESDMGDYPYLHDMGPAPVGRYHPLRSRPREEIRPHRLHGPAFRLSWKLRRRPCRRAFQISLEGRDMGGSPQPPHLLRHGRQDTRGFQDKRRLHGRCREREQEENLPQCRGTELHRLHRHNKERQASRAHRRPEHT